MKKNGIGMKILIWPFCLNFFKITNQTNSSTQACCYAQGLEWPHCPEQEDSQSEKTIQWITYQIRHLFHILGLFKLTVQFMCSLKSSGQDQNTSLVDQNM